MKACVFFLTVLAGFASSQISAAQPCQSKPQRHAKLISGEVAGKHAYIEDVAGKWLFKLEPSPHGWDIRLRDRDAMDLSQITPPFHGLANPRQLYGWHFRNAANTGVNTGDVNAPQQLRLFQFSPALSGTGGYRPPVAGAIGSEQPDPDNGRGALTVTDMGLANLEPGEKARMIYLKFHACLTWSKTQEEIIEVRNAGSQLYLDEEKESMFGCGLEPRKFKLSAWVMPRLISGDMDGDDAMDEIAPIVRKRGGRRGIALCRAGTWLSVLGYDDKAQIPLKPGYYTLEQYLDKIEFWEMRPNSEGADMLVLGQIEKSEVGIFWDGSKFTHRLLAHLVEP